MSAIDQHPPGTPSWFDITVPDLDAARKFYGALFGWEFGPEGSPETGYYTTATKNGKTCAGLGKVRADDPSPPHWSVWFATSDAEETAKAVKKNGGQIMMGPMDVMEHGRMLLFSDPTEAFCGVWQPGAHKGAEIVNEHGTMCWCEVTTNDVPKAAKFYGSLFDLSPEVLEGPTEYTVLNRGKMPVAGVMKMPAEWKGVPPHWMPYFQVDDVDATVAGVPRAGGKVMAPAFDTPYGRIAVLTDPAGANFSIMTPSRAS